MSSLHGLEKTFKVLPALRCSALSTPTTSHPTDWPTLSNSSHSSPLDSGTPLTQSEASLEQLEEQDEGILYQSCISGSAAISNVVAPLNEYLPVQPASRPTPTITSTNTSSPATHFLTQIIQSANTVHCLNIVKALQSPIFDKRVSTHNITVDNLRPIITGLQRRYA